MTRLAESTPERHAGCPAAAGLLRGIARNPAAPLMATVVGPGGTGKSEIVAAVAQAYEQAGVPVARGGVGIDRIDPDQALLVDDAHRLDPQQLDLVRTFVERGGSRLLLAHRPWPRPSELQAVTAGVTVGREILVTSHLDLDGVAARIPTRPGVPPPPGLVEFVHEQSGGLAALVDVITQALCDAGLYDRSRPKDFRRPDRIVVSKPLAERLRHHVDVPDPAVQAVLEALSVGASLDLEILHRLLAVGPDSPELATLTGSVETAMATGLLTDAGVLIPCVRSIVLRLMPLMRTRDLQRRLAEIELDRGGSVLVAGRRLLGTGATGERVAAVFDAAADEALTESPAQAVELLAAAVEAGAPPLAVAGRRAFAAALAGDLDQALRFADQVITAPAAPDRDLAVAAAATAHSHRGLLANSAELQRFLRPELAVLAVPALIGTGALDDARAVIAASPRADGPSSLLAGAAALMAAGMLDAVTGSASAALSRLARAAVLLEPVAATTLLPDTPAALTAIVAMQSGELTVAEAALRRAAIGRHGGRAALPRHRLLHAWVAMSRGRLDRARRLLNRNDGRLEPRDELVAAALAMGLARRGGDNAALSTAWRRARSALVEHPVDLYSLPYLGECLVAVARLGEPDWLAPHLAEADHLLDALGRPALWTATLHWYRLHAAVVLDDADAVAEHAAALAPVASTGAYHAVLAAAAESWASVAAGAVDADAVQVAARRLSGIGLVWEAAHLAGQAGLRARDRRAVLALQACARALINPSEATTDPEPHGDSDGDGGEPGDAGTDAGTDTQDTEPESPAAAAGGEPPAPVLSGRELEIGTLVLAGLTYKQIGEQLFISAKTVEHHVARIRGRLGVTSRNELFGRLRALI